MAIELDGVTKRFGALAAVDGVTAKIAETEFFVVLGASGCGKSTLLRLIAGLETLDAGTIALDGRPVAGPGLHVAPEDRGTGVVFQSYALWPHMSVADNVAFPIEARGARRDRAREAAGAHIDTVALTGLEHRKPADLSGGQRQRVALARCLAGGARTILMDEPLANLDPHLRTAMESELARFHRQTGATTLYITHDQREAMALADRIAVMDSGRFLQIGAPREIYARPACETVARFIGRSAVLEAAATPGSSRAAVGPLSVDLTGPVPASGHARVVIRPSNVRLADAGEPGSAPGRIASVSYRGETWEAQVAVAGLAEPLPLSADRPIDPGTEVTVALATCWILPASQDGQNYDFSGSCNKM